MASKDLYFIDDPVYSLKFFILTPFDSSAHGTLEDNYNYFHSSLHISVECCFGEVDLQLGIFWWSLKYSLNIDCCTIDACLWLHNFILDNSDYSFMESIDKDIFD
jgi:hypothetical protein